MSETFDKIKDAEEQLLCRSYSRFPVAISHGLGSHVWDFDGKEYIDLLAGIAVTPLGHCNPELNEVLASQAKQLWQISNLFYQEPQLELARSLLATTHHSRAFFCNSGAEANEACIKLARRYMRKVKAWDAYEIITLQGCFHGRTLGTLAATGRDSLSDGFTPLPEGFKQVPAGDIEAMAAAIVPETAAVLLECVQGEGGVIPLDPQYLRAVEKLCRDKDILLICDEVQCGLCRTGRFWGFQHSGIRPDAISVAKGLANGLAMGAMLATDEMAKGFVPGSHATTFGGGALTSAVANKVVEIMIRDQLAERAAKTGADFMEKIRVLQSRNPGKIREVRGLGLMIGIEMGFDAKSLWLKLLQSGFICGLSHGYTLRLLPALITSASDLDRFASALEKLLADF